MRLLSFVIITLLFVSCVPQSSITGRSIANSQDTSPLPEDVDPADPDFSSSLNFIQYGQTELTTTVNLQKSYSDTLYIRGEQIHTYITGNSTEINCLTVFFSTVTAIQGNSLLVIAARPNSFFNLQTGLREYYYMITPADQISNATYCQKPEVINQLSATYPGRDITYELSSIAQNTISIVAPSDSLKLMNQFGQSISSISLTNLNFNMTSDTQDQPPVGQSCSSSAECVQAGYDCCTSGQCIKDGGIISGVDQTTTDFLQALQDISITPSHVQNYPQYFNFCPIDTPPDPIVLLTPDPADDPDVHFADTKDLYDCTTPFAGEMSVCTFTMKDITNDTLHNYLPLKTSPYDLAYTRFYSGTNSSQLLENAIYQIFYGDRILYDVNDTITYNDPLNPDLDKVSLGVSNFNFSDPTSFTLPLNTSGVETLPVSGTDATLRIRYTADGSCEYVSPDLVKCFKSYIQGTNVGLSTDHFPGNLPFRMPYYADTGKYVQVTVDNIPRTQGQEWNLNFADSSVSFITPIEDNEVVKITFYVNSDVYPVYAAKKEALTSIEEHCNCVGPGCSLKPVYDINGGLLDFTCHYPPTDTVEPPMQSVVLVSAKAVPQRFFNFEGKEITDTNLITGMQEGNEFEYLKGDRLQPNNIYITDPTIPIGFNEIYGNISYAVDSASPPQIVDVLKGRSYDIFTESGSFSTCTTCGSDYYSQLIKLFPDNFLYRGGGYYPDPSETSRLNSSTYRADDLIFGRACFVPATMIPWSHHASYDQSIQRKKRLATQHFLFANGYQRDWYGFDYGAIIGSFDGVAWFAIGNQRRIRATTNKLYIAVNSYFGDLTQSSSFTVSITDTSLSYGGGGEVSTDFYNDGAQCQKYHECEVDQDCIAQLGWEYSCQPVTQIQTEWPRFDQNAKEILDASDTKRLIDIIVGGFTGSVKRCVYRGRGAPCSTNYSTVDAENSYSKTATPGLNACTSNNYCQVFSSGGDKAKFNNKIARFGRSPDYQNASAELLIAPADTFGFEARVLGHPFDFNGTEIITTEARGGLNQNSIFSLCVPGHNTDQSNYLTAHRYEVTQKSYSGDRVSGIGMTSYDQNSDNYYSYCSILDDNGNYLHLSNPTIPADNISVRASAASQALSTNALSIFKTIDTSLKLLTDFKQSVVSQKYLDTNSCLRAPGSVCHTDMDCGPSSFVTQKLANIDDERDQYLNRSERKFWKETLVCSQAEPTTSVDYDLKNNRCCRENGQQITVPTFQERSPDNDLFKIPGYVTNGVNINNENRISRFMMLAKLRADESNDLRSSATYPVLRSAVDNSCTSTGASCEPYATLENQFNTLNTVSTNTCCSQHWIRNFDKIENNGGHTWNPTRLQSFNYEGLKCLNWGQKHVDANRIFSCDPAEAPDYATCTVKNITLVDADLYFQYFGTLELLGIPQIAVKSSTYAEARCVVDSNQITTSTIPIDNTTVDNTGLGQEQNYEYKDGVDYLYSATDMDNFSSSLKKVFSQDDISCCQPTGLAMPNDAVPDDCCTGNLVDQYCCLPDYTDVSVYTNRYVSSSAKGLNPINFDAKTGYITDANIVEQIARQEALCCSGSVMRGKALYTLGVKGLEDQAYRVRRFFDGQTLSVDPSAVIQQEWQAGAKWNNHVYCAPVL